MFCSTSVTDTLIGKSVLIWQQQDVDHSLLVFFFNLYYCFNIVSATIVGHWYLRQMDPPNNPQSLILCLSKVIIVNIVSYQLSQPIYRRSAPHHYCKKRWYWHRQTTIIIIIEPIRLTLHKHNNQWFFIVGVSSFPCVFFLIHCILNLRAQERQWQE